MRLTQRTPSLQTRDNLSFRLSATNAPDSEPKGTPPHRCLLRDLRDKDGPQHSSLDRPPLDRLHTDEFFDHFDQLFRVKFASPEKEAEMDATRVPTRPLEEPPAQPPAHLIGSCTLGQQEAALGCRPSHRRVLRPSTTKHSANQPAALHVLRGRP